MPLVTIASLRTDPFYQRDSPLESLINFARFYATPLEYTAEIKNKLKNDLVHFQTKSAKIIEGIEKKTTFVADSVGYNVEEWNVHYGYDCDKEIKPSTCVSIKIKNSDYKSTVGWIGCYYGGTE